MWIGIRSGAVPAATSPWSCLWYGLAVDFVINDLSMRQRTAYVRSVLALTRPGSRLLLWCLEWEPRRWNGSSRPPPLRRDDAPLGWRQRSQKLARVPGGVSVSCSDTRYAAEVIVSFRHKGLERLYRGGSKKGVQAAHIPKLLRILSLLDVAQSPDDLAIPSFRTHPLKGDLAGHWSIWVSGNWRITFRFNETDVELVDYQDYH